MEMFPSKTEYIVGANGKWKDKVAQSSKRPFQ